MVRKYTKETIQKKNTEESKTTRSREAGLFCTVYTEVSSIA